MESYAGMDTGVSGGPRNALLALARASGFNSLQASPYARRCWPACTPVLRLTVSPSLSYTALRAA